MIECRRLFTGLLLAGLLSGSQPLWSQAGREKVLEGNRNFSKGDYDKALELYREALEESPDSSAVRFNLGDAHFKKEEMEDAADSFSQALQSEDPEIKSRAQYNLGNSFFRQGKLQESLGAYREALKLAPGDRDAKHNLEFVLKQLQEQQQQQKNQNQQGEGEQEKDKDKNQDESQSDGGDQSEQSRQDRPEDQQGRDGNDRKDSEDSEQRPADPQENRDEKSRAAGQQQEPPQEGQAQAPPGGSQPMSREEAERLLEALAQAQAGIKKKLELRPGTVKVEKDW